MNAFHAALLCAHNVPFNHALLLGRLDHLQQKLATVSADAAELRALNAALAAEDDAWRASLDAVQARMDALVVDNDDQRARLEKLGAENDDLRAQLAAVATGDPITPHAAVAWVVVDEEDSAV